MWHAPQSPVVDQVHLVMAQLSSNNALTVIVLAFIRIMNSSCHKDCTLLSWHYINCYTAY